MVKQNLAGKKFGRLTVVSLVGQPASKARWLCQCSCGGETTVLGYNLKSGHTSSCGCIYRESRKTARRTHGQSGSPEYIAYCALIARCGNQKRQSYHRYGGRGIKIHRRWLGKKGFINFLADMGKKPSPAHSVERKNNSGSYSAKNCRWATQREQCRNKHNTHYIIFGGKKMPLIAACEQVGLPYHTVRARLCRLGWSVAQALTTQVSSCQGGRKRKGKK